MPFSTRIARRHFGHHTGMRRMVIALGDQGRARRAADRRGVETVVAQTLGGQFVERRGGNRAAESGYAWVVAFLVVFSKWGSRNASRSG